MGLGFDRLQEGGDRLGIGQQGRGQARVRLERSGNEDRGELVKNLGRDIRLRFSPDFRGFGKDQSSRGERDSQDFWIRRLQAKFGHFPLESLTLMQPKMALSALRTIHGLTLCRSMLVVLIFLFKFLGRVADAKIELFILVCGGCIDT
ncbi:hypothetical protein M5K25_004867 [Dendrobium thyrsiflorum]|uniref:Uncharacterized protein n=1 Tax=Dendrobium thyrsiflorum TaxID=117978 RepID=A0ABD0VFY8_DENTH